MAVLPNLNTTLFSNQMSNFNPANAGNNSASAWFMDQYNKINPQLNYTTDSFNNAVKSGRTDLAYMQLAQGGQQYRDAVQKANNWTDGQMNSVINSYGLYGNNGGGQGMTGMAARYSPENIATLKSLGASSPTTQTFETHQSSPNWVPDSNWANNMNNQFNTGAGTGGGAAANPTGYGAGYTGYGNSVLSAPNPQVTGNGTTTAPTNTLPTVDHNYTAGNRGIIAPPPGGQNAVQQQSNAPVAPAPTQGRRVAPPPLGLPGTTVGSPSSRVAPMPTRYTTLDYKKF